MRIVAWNCQQRADEKFASLRSLNPDFVVLSEASAISPDGWSTEWIGRNPAKGLAVLGRPGVSISRSASYDPAWEWFLPVDAMDGPISVSVVGVWAMNHRGKGPMPSRGRTLRTLEAYQTLLSERRSVVMGDFNNNLIWDTPTRPQHRAIVDRMAEMGYRSVYHEQTGEPPGQESRPTFYWYRHRSRPYHIDYCFVPEEWLPRVHLEIGTPESWLDKSDHLPLILDIDR